MDGYAVRFEDIANCTSENPISLDISEEMPAGIQPLKFLQSNQACRTLHRCNVAQWSRHYSYLKIQINSVAVKLEKPLTVAKFLVIGMFF